MNYETYTYRIDAGDVIVELSDNWSTFAEANAGGGALQPEQVLGRGLWDFIQDSETRQLYEDLFRRARSGRRAAPIPFRCDSPRERRFLQLELEVLPDQSIQITSRILRTEPRTPVPLLDAQLPRTSGLLRICSMCKKVEVAPSEWAEVEEALARLRS